MIHTIIIEDDPMVAQINRQYLEHFKDFKTDEIFSNGIDAYTYLERNLVDLIILDIYMPTMTGIQLLQKLRMSGIKVSVIIVTAASESQIVSDSLELGIIDYLIKPFTFERFGEAIQKYLNKTHLLCNNSYVDQQTVDRLINNDFTSDKDHAAELSKGLNHVTMETIYAYLKNNQQEKHTCESLSAACGLSKVTIRRYLNYLIDIGKLQSTIDYETGGRPRTLYMLI